MELSSYYVDASSKYISCPSHASQSNIQLITPHPLTLTKSSLNPYLQASTQTPTELTQTTSMTASTTQVPAMQKTASTGTHVVDMAGTLPPTPIEQGNKCSYCGLNYTGSSQVCQCDN